MVCLTCHEPHTWDPNKSNPDLNRTMQNIDGDAANSFLRKANFPASNLCKSCHPAQARVDGTDHDLQLTAPQAVNITGQTAKMSGACGACHLVHNSPNKLRLWARSLHFDSKNENVMSALCLGCHSKGNPAEKKVPPIATHPAGKLINNIVRFNRSNEGYTPLFNQNGVEVNVGNVSCPSCHDAHQWSPFSRGTTDQADNSNTIDKFQFLRNMSKDLVCIDCHGTQALYRYLYFHSPDKREKMKFIPAHQSFKRESIF